MGKTPIEILQLGREWIHNLYAQSIHEQAAQNLFLLELAMLTHQPGDKSSATRMTNRVRKIANGLENMLLGDKKETKEKSDPLDGRLIMTN